MILYHFTSEEGRSILSSGFTGDVWLSHGPQTIDGTASTDVLLEVTISENIERFRQRVTIETINDSDPDQGDDWGDYQTPEYRWYCVPSDVLNPMIESIRVIERGSDEYLELM